MAHVLIKNGAVDTYPYTFAMLRNENPTVSYPRNPSDAKLAEWDVYPVQPSTKPNYDLTKNIVEGTPQNIDGLWFQTWTEVPASAEEIAGRQASAKTRDERLEVKQDTFVNNFISMSPTQVNTYVDDNVTDLASAKNVINKLALMVLLLARAEFEE